MKLVLFRWFNLASLLGLWLIFNGCSREDMVCTKYFDNGEIESTVPCPNGVYNGEMRIFTKTGRLWSTRMYKDGVIVDTTRFYFYKGGKLLKSVPMKEGLKHGLAQQFREDGSLESSTPYQEDLKEGIAMKFYENGKLQEERPYTSGLLDGTYKLYSEEGKIIREGQFYQHRKLGKWRTFYPNENPKYSFTYYGNMRHGGFGVFRKNGMPYITGTYDRDEVHGSVKFFSKEGVIVKEQRWENGSPLSGTTAENEEEIVDIRSISGEKFHIQILKDTVIIR